MTSLGDGVLGRLYPDWPQYASRLVEGIRDLTAEQLAIRAAPEHMPIWGLAAHTAGMRTYWLCGIFGEPGAASTPFPDPSTGIGWEDDETHPRTAIELVWALESTWDIVAACLDRWTMPMLAERFERRTTRGLEWHTRASVLNRMFSHDAYHAGEISQLLGVHGLPQFDLWETRIDGLSR